MSRRGGPTVRYRITCSLPPALAAAVLMAASPISSRGQDIEALAERNGVSLPASYYAQVRADPDFYEFQRGLFGRVGAGGERIRGGPSLAPARAPASGSVRLPVVLALFQDSPEEPHISREMVQAALFSGPSVRGTIREAYDEMSRGALDVDGDVYGWVRTGLTMSEVVGTDRGFGPDARIGEYLVQALDSIDDSVDFTLYDNDGPDGIPNSGDDDGFVDVLTFEYLEVAASCGGPAIWPHRTTMENRTGEPYATDDLGTGGTPILVQDYITQSAANCTGETVQDAAVITHEFGHALGLPDWYHWIDRDAGPFGRRWVLGCWALMAAGSWGCGPVTEDRAPFGPTHMIGFSKWYLGWVDAIEVGEVWNEEIVLDAMEASGRPLRIQLDEAGDEFLFAELRLPMGFDRELPGAGVLFYKEDDNASIRPDPTTGDPYFLTMLERDANSTLLRTANEGGNRGEAGDAWGSGEGRSALNGASLPALRLADGRYSTAMVHEVRMDGDQARVIVSTGRTPRLFAPGSAVEVMQVRGFSVPVRIAGGAGPYTLEGALPDGFSATATGDELLLTGSVRDAESRIVELSVRDSEGRMSGPVALEVTGTTPWSVDRADLFRGFLRDPEDPLTPPERDYMDEAGNGNGIYDVGDLRRWLREGGS